MDQPFQVVIQSENQTTGIIVIEPLRKGFGHTLGNGLRRTMLTHLQGAAPVKVKIKGVTHQFTTLSGMKEDIVEFILNLKQLCVAYQGETPEVLKLDTTGPGIVTAKDFAAPSTVKIANPDLVLASLADKKSKLVAEVTVQIGTGYALAEEQGKQKLGVIPLDANFSPVSRVSYHIESTRVGRRTDFDKLVLQIVTDGTLKPSEAVAQAAKILVSHFQVAASPTSAVGDDNVLAAKKGKPQILKLTVEELDLPTRVANALRRGGFKTIGDLAKATAADVAAVKNIGEKSVVDILEKLAEKGVEVAQTS